MMRDVMHCCSGCGAEKPPEQFPPDNRVPSGRNSRCRACCNESKRAKRRSTTRDCWSVLIVRMQAVGHELRSIEGFPNYRVCSDGSVWGVGLSRGRVRAKPKRVQGEVKDNGYLQVILYGVGGERRYVAVHTLVLEAFVSPCPDGMECRHKNGVKLDNAVTNLAWGTHLENEADKELHGTRRRCENHPNAKLNRAKVAEIRRAWGDGFVTIAALAAEHAVDASTICDVVYRRTWRTVT